MTDLMKLARDRPCSIRLPGCTGGGADTVGAHYRSISLGAGMGIKTHSIFVAHACHHCHSVVDGRDKIEGYSRDTIRQYHAEGVLRTIKWLIDAGYVRVGRKEAA